VTYSRQGFLNIFQNSDFHIRLQTSDLKNEMRLWITDDGQISNIFSFVCQQRKPLSYQTSNKNWKINVDSP